MRRTIVKHGIRRTPARTVCHVGCHDEKAARDSQTTNHRQPKTLAETKLRTIENGLERHCFILLACNRRMSKMGSTRSRNLDHLTILDQDLSVPGMRLGVVRSFDGTCSIDGRAAKPWSKKGYLLSRKDGFLESFLGFEIFGGVHLNLKATLKFLPEPVPATVVGKDGRWVVLLKRIPIEIRTSHRKIAGNPALVDGGALGALNLSTIDENAFDHGIASKGLRDGAGLKANNHTLG